MTVQSGVHALGGEVAQATRAVQLQAADDTNAIQMEVAGASRVAAAERASSARDILGDACHNTASIIASSERIAFAGQDRTDKVGLANLNSIDANGTRNLQSIERNDGEIRANIAQSTGDMHCAVKISAAESRSGTAAGFTLTQLGVKDSLLASKDVLIGVMDAAETGMNHSWKTRKDVIKSEGRQQFLAEKNFGIQRLDLCKTETALTKQASDNYLAVQLEALRNKAELEAQVAECCCELKHEVVHSAAVSQALIRDTEAAALRDSFNTATQESLFLRLTGSSHSH
jgi:hypothetical protein